MTIVRRQLAARMSSLEAVLSPADRARADQLLKEDLAAWSAPAFDEQPGRRGSGQGDVHRFACGAPPGESMGRRRSTGG